MSRLSRPTSVAAGGSGGRKMLLFSSGTGTGELAQGFGTHLPAWTNSLAFLQGPSALGGVKEAGFVGPFEVCFSVLP